MIIFLFLFLMPLFGLLVLISMGVLFGARATASVVLVVTGVGLFVGFLILCSFLNFLGGLFR